MQRKFSHGFRVKLLREIEYIFESQVTRNAWVKKVKKALSEVGVEEGLDYEVVLVSRPRPPTKPKLTVKKGGRK